MITSANPVVTNACRKRRLDHPVRRIGPQGVTAVLPDGAQANTLQIPVVMSVTTDYNNQQPLRFRPRLRLVTTRLQKLLTPTGHAAGDRRRHDEDLILEQTLTLNIPRDFRSARVEYSLNNAVDYLGDQSAVRPRPATSTWTLDPASSGGRLRTWVAPACLSVLTDNSFSGVR